MIGVLRDPTLRRFAVAQGLLEVQFWFPVWWFFLAERGFSLGEAVAADCAFRIVVVVCEVPLGLVADWLGHRTSFVAVAAMATVTFVLITFVSSPWELMAVWIIWGVLWAASSGVGSAYLYELATQGCLGAEVGHSFGIVRAVSSLSSGASLMAAGALFTADPKLPFLATSALAAIALGLTLTLPSTTSPSRARPGRAGIQLVRNNPAIRAAICIGSTVLLVGWSITILFQPLIMEVELSPTLSGYLYAAYAVAGFGGALAAGRLHTTHHASALVGAYVMIAVGVLAAGIPLGPAAIAIVPLIGLGYQMAWTLVELGINSVSSPETRVTALSIVSCVGGLGIAAGRPLLGWMSEAYSASFAFAAWGVFGLVLALPVSRIARGADQRETEPRTCAR